jgi:hypothetical protein
LKTELKMRGLDGVGDFLAQLREELGNNAVPRKPLAVFRFEKLFPNDAVAIEKKISRSSEALLHSGGFCVQHAISLNDLRVRVRNHRVVNLVPVSEKLQDLLRVIADGRELDPLRFESRDGALQLDQLPFAERSPVGGTKKEEDSSLRSFQGIESLCSAKLVAR